MTEINEDIVKKDLEEILQHLTQMNKTMQKLYIKISEIVKEVTQDG